MAVLKVAHATKSFGTIKALDGASFDLAEGELLALLGPNGAGKTTLIRAVTGRVRLDGGEILLFDRRLSSGRTPRELGIVPQDVALYPLMTARENLGAFGRLQGLSGHGLRSQIDWVLERTGLADRANEPITRFSGGMRRRLNIGCGILHRPRVVLLDEPTVGVDPQSRDHIYDVLAQLQSEGVSLLLTTHHLEEAEARCTRTVIIDHGKVIASGTLSELVDGTVGRHRIVTLRVDLPFDAGHTIDGRGGGQAAIEIDAVDARIARVRLADVGADLPPLLERLRATGRSVEDIDVRGPSLQAVFIHLTGRELRE
jgi:ABC-2 type transport system ATP-binding protein